MTAEKLKAEENNNRNKLKEEKPLVYAKVAKFDEKIKRGESIAIIQFQYNYVCNFACQHCSIKGFQGRKDAKSFTLADVKELFRQADELGLARVTITGGEPLVFKDFDGLVAAIDPQKFYINCDTNGWFLDEKKALHLKSIGVDRIQLSLDSLNAAEHDDFRKAPGSHERALKAVDAAVGAVNVGVAHEVFRRRQCLAVPAPEEHPAATGIIDRAPIETVVATALAIQRRRPR